jgi:hypothetical protein
MVPVPNSRPGFLRRMESAAERLLWFYETRAKAKISQKSPELFNIAKIQIQPFKTSKIGPILWRKDNITVNIL